MMRWCSFDFETTFEAALPSVYTPQQLAVIRGRYLTAVAAAEGDYRLVSALYITLTNAITLSGVLIAALTPLEHMDWVSPTGGIAIFWIAWGLAIFLTLANKVVTTFNVAKKYVLGVVVVEKLHSEGWSFAAGVGRYAMSDDNERFATFCARVEHIKLKSVESMPEMNGDSSAVLASASNVVVATDSD